MRNKIKLLGIISMLVIIVITMVSCQEYQKDEYTLVIQNETSVILDVTARLGNSRWEGQLIRGGSHTVKDRRDQAFTGSPYTITYKDFFSTGEPKEKTGFIPKEVGKLTYPIKDSDL
jgi:hypothetical protein